MSPQLARSPLPPVDDDEVDEVLAEFNGDWREAIRALLHDQAALVVDAEQAVSHGYIQGKFSEGARRLAADDEP